MMRVLRLLPASLRIDTFAGSPPNGRWLWSARSACGSIASCTRCAPVLIVLITPAGDSRRSCAPHAGWRASASCVGASCSWATARNRGDTRRSPPRRAVFGIALLRPPPPHA